MCGNVIIAKEKKIKQKKKIEQGKSYKVSVKGGKVKCLVSLCDFALFSWLLFTVLICIVKGANVYMVEQEPSR